MNLSSEEKSFFSSPKLLDKMFRLVPPALYPKLSCVDQVQVPRCNKSSGDLLLKKRRVSSFHKGGPALPPRPLPSPPALISPCPPSRRLSFILFSESRRVPLLSCGADSSAVAMTTFPRLHDTLLAFSFLLLHLVEFLFLFFSRLPSVSSGPEKVLETTQI